MLRNFVKQFQIKQKPRPIQLFLYIFGLIVLNLGVVLTVHSGAGASGFDSLVFALNHIFQLRLAYVVYIVSFLCVLMAAGICLLSFGVGVYLLSELPAGPIDDLVVALHERKLSLRAAKLSVDLSCLTLAFFLGGTVGWGSLVLNFALGPLVQFWNKRCDWVVNKRILS